MGDEGEVWKLSVERDWGEGSRRSGLGFVLLSEIDLKFVVDNGG